MKYIIDIDGIKYSFCAENITDYRIKLKEYLKTKPLNKRTKNLIPDLYRYLHHGWMQPILFSLETMAWGRWGYWMEINLNQCLPNRAIPEIYFHRDEETFKHLEDVLNCIPNDGFWNSYGNSHKVMDYLLDWLLFAFGSSNQKTLPQEPHGCEGASMRLYQVFCLDKLIGYPYDYFGDLFSEARFGENLGFFPTPLEVCDLMAMILSTKEDESSEDIRDRTAFDPCIGTGRTLLYQSNSCLRGYGQELNPLCVKACLVNFFMYAPWYAAALPLEYLQANPVSGIKSFIEPDEPNNAIAQWAAKQYGYHNSTPVLGEKEDVFLTGRVATNILKLE